VGKNIIDYKCINYNPLCFYLNFQGNVISEGSYNNLKASSFDFAKFLVNSKRDDIENKIEINNKNSIISSKQENQISDAQALNPENSALQTYEYNSKNTFISYIIAGGSTLNICFCIFMCILTQILITIGDFWLSFWYYLYGY